MRERGFDVDVITAGDPSRLPAAASAAWMALQPAGARLLAAPPADAPALIVDALFGVGLSRAIASPYAGWIEWANACDAPILALDVPSGLDAGTGVAHPPTIDATATATFIALKPGLLTCDGPDHCGELSVHALDIDDAQRRHRRAARMAAAARELPAILARRVRKTHKGTFGRACVIGGAEGLVGAALLAGRAALRLGAGRVVVGLAARNPPLVDWGSPELMLREAGSRRRRLRRVGRRARPRRRRTRAGDRRQGGAATRSRSCSTPTRSTRSRPIASLRDAVAQRDAPTLATPHPAEAARLLGCDTPAVQADRVGAATRAGDDDCARTSC